jgi:hypothetical protein
VHIEELLGSATQRQMMKLHVYSGPDTVARKYPSAGWLETLGQNQQHCVGWLEPAIHLSAH